MISASPQIKAPAIPDDIMNVATEIASDWAMPETELGCERAVARALMAERERAAKIIEDFASGRTMTGDAVKARKVPSQTSILMAQLIRGEA